MYLFAVGAISNVSYSADTICAGTELDPCYAYINFTANEDIFIYPMNATWALETDNPDAIELIKMYRTWGKDLENLIKQNLHRFLVWMLLVY